jgi:phosphopantothenate synthetase
VVVVSCADGDRTTPLANHLKSYLCVDVLLAGNLCLRDV